MAAVSISEYVAIFLHLQLLRVPGNLLNAYGILLSAGLSSGAPHLSIALTEYGGEFLSFMPEMLSLYGNSVALSLAAIPLFLASAMVYGRKTAVIATVLFALYASSAMFTGWDIFSNAYAFLGYALFIELILLISRSKVSPALGGALLGALFLVESYLDWWAGITLLLSSVAVMLATLALSLSSREQFSPYPEHVSALKGGISIALFLSVPLFAIQFIWLGSFIPVSNFLPSYSISVVFFRAASLSYSIYIPLAILLPFGIIGVMLSTRNLFKQTGVVMLIILVTVCLSAGAFFLGNGITEESQLALYAMLPPSSFAMARILRVNSSKPV